MACGHNVALFRAINVGGHGNVAMADLRAMAEGLGLCSARTVVQTGNLLFASEAPAGDLEILIENAAADRFGLKTDVVVLDADEWARLVAENPFAAAARADPAHLVLLVLKTQALSGAQAALEAAIRGREQVKVLGRSAYVAFPDGIGRSKLTMQVLERHLGTRATGRNWNTVEKIAAALSP